MSYPRVLRSAALVHAKSKRFLLMSKINLLKNILVRGRLSSLDVILPGLGVIRVQRCRNCGYGFAIAHKIHFHSRTCAPPLDFVLSSTEMLAVYNHGARNIY